MKRICSILLTLIALQSMSATAIELTVNFGPPSPTPLPADSKGLLSLVKKYADVMIASGRDTYGSVKSPVFASILQRNPITLPSGTLTSPVGIRPQDRAFYGADVAHDQNLYRLLYTLSDATGDPRYSREADAALSFFLSTYKVSCNFFTWGEHMYWNFTKEGLGTGKEYYNTHELFRPWDLFEQSYRLNNGAMNRFAKALWDVQVYDHTGYFSRHATACKADGQHSNFPRHAGFYLEHWAKAYRNTGDNAYVTAANAIAKIYDKEMRNPSTNGIKAGRKDAYLTTVWVYSEASLAVSIGIASKDFSGTTAQALSTLAAHIDDHVTTLRHDLAAKGFVCECQFSNDNILSYFDDWRLDYGGEMTNAGFASLIYDRYLQTQSAAYKALILKSADAYIAKTPSTTELWPGSLAQAITGQLNAYYITNDRKYLTRARYFADWAIPKFLDGTSGLPRASTKAGHYESITRGDTFMLSLLELFLAEKGTPHHFSFVDR